MIGHGRGIQAVLGHHVFVPFARCTFGAYLLHPLLMAFLILNEKKGAFFDYNMLMIKFFGFAVISYAASVLATALLESPVVCFDREFIRYDLPVPQKPREIEEASLVQRSNKPPEELQVLTLPIDPPPVNPLPS